MSDVGSGTAETQNVDANMPSGVSTLSTDGARQTSEPSSSSPSAPNKRAGMRSDPKAAKRGRRMFDLLNTTLTKAKEDNVRRSTGEAGRKRALIEARLQKKLQEEPVKQRKLEELGKRLRHLLQKMIDLQIKIESTDSAIRLRKSQKRRLASFLVTSSDLTTFDGKIAEQNAVDQTVLAPDVALVLAPIGPDHPRAISRPDSHPIYFLPNKNFATQEDRLDEQEDRVDEEIDKADDAWREEKGEIQREIERVKEEVLEIKSEMEKLERSTNDDQDDMEMIDVEKPIERQGEKSTPQHDSDEKMNEEN